MRRGSRYIVAAALFFGAGVSAHEQQRDPSASATGATASGTARVSGTVVSTDAQHQPLRGAIVTLTGPSLPLGRSSITNDDGRFVIDRLPAGRYTLVATKAAYLTTAYGAMRPARPGVSLLIADGQQLSDVSIAMPHGAAITGRVTESGGHPATGAQVTVIRQRRSGAMLAVTVESAAFTDDRGVFRVFGLAPGDYLVAAEPRGGSAGAISMMTSAEVDATFAAIRQLAGGSAPLNRAPASIVVPPARRTFGIAPTYFPGVSSSAQAARITLGVGEERAGVDFNLSFVPIATLAGTVVSGSGSMPRVQFIINSDAVETLSTSSFDSRPRVTGPGTDGTFTVANVAPGHYVIVVRTTAPAAPPGGAPLPASTDSPILFANADVTVNGDDVTGLVLALQPALRLTGRVVVDQMASRPQPDLTKVVLNLTDDTRAQAVNGPAIGGAAPVRGDGTLDVPGLVPATYRITATLPAGSGLWMRSLMVAGRDVLDVGLDVRAGADLSGAVLTLSDRHSSLTGTLHTPSDQAPIGYFIVVYPSDRSMWRPQARRVRMVRPGSDGTFTTTDLPAGEYYMAALTDVERDDLADPAFLEALVAASVRVTLAEGENKVQDLRIVR